MPFDFFCQWNKDCINLKVKLKRMLPIFVITFKQSHLYFIQTCKTRRSIGVGSHPVELAAKWNGQHATCALFMAKHQ